MSNFSGVRTQSAFNKSQLLELYDGVDMRTFEAWIDDIKGEIGWRKRKQVFPPIVVRRIIEHIGEPITLKVL